MDEREVRVDGRAVMVRDAGDPDGSPLLYVHGTPGSRSDVRFGDDSARHMGVRVISFDRPGYGGSAPAAYSLGSVARDAGAVADSLGVDRFASLGWSGGGPFALAAAAELGERVTRVGVVCANARFQEMPGAMDDFTENDRQALAFLPEHPDRAAEQFRIANEDTLQAMASVREDESAPWIDWMWGETDPAVVSDPALRRALYSVVHEGLRQGPMGICWDNVAWSGDWGFEMADVEQPVHLWYGEQDQMVSPANGRWLSDQLPEATLAVYEGEGHLVPMRHWPDILRTLARKGSVA